MDAPTRGPKSLPFDLNTVAPARGGPRFFGFLEMLIAPALAPYTRKSCMHARRKWGNAVFSSGSGQIKRRTERQGGWKAVVNHCAVCCVLLPPGSALSPQQPFFSVVRVPSSLAEPSLHLKTLFDFVPGRSHDSSGGDVKKLCA